MANHTGDKDCSDFQFQEDAQDWLRQHPTDPDGLDADNDGEACESLPGRARNGDDGDKQDGDNSDGDKDCSDFKFQEDAQDWLEKHPGDPDVLDADNDGVACEDLPDRDDKKPRTTTSSTSTSSTTSTTRVTIPPRPSGETASSGKPSPSSAAPGQSITITGEGFAPNSTLSVTFAGASASPPSTTADAVGGYSVTLVIPGAARSGPQAIVVSGTNPAGGRHRSTTTVTVTLAQTGAGHTWWLALAAAVLLVSGSRLTEWARWSRPVSTVAWKRRG